MDLLDFLNHYWTILAGIASFIATIVYAQNEIKNNRRDMILQKEEHDRQIAELKTSHATLETKFSEHKDKISDSMNLIQQDIREIMTILKRDNR